MHGHLDVGQFSASHLGRFAPEKETTVAIAQKAAAPIFWINQQRLLNSGFQVLTTVLLNIQFFSDMTPSRLLILT
jgi:hypothetical protein